MNEHTWLSFGLGGAMGLFGCVLMGWALRAVCVQVEEEEAVLITSFGKLVRAFREAGLHFYPWKILPWVKAMPISLRRDFRDFKKVHVNDARGTTVLVDLWLEYRIEDPVKALFQVADWDRSLQNLVSHAATSILGNLEFKKILCSRAELGQMLQEDIREETARWGLKIELVLIRNVTLIPEVSKQIFDAIAARLERAKADIEETGRLAVAQLEADTSVQVSKLVAEAKGQYPLAVGRALSETHPPEVLAAYKELYALSQIRPHRTVAFRGFGRTELSASDAVMIAPMGKFEQSE